METINLNQLKTLKIAVNNDSVYLTIDEGGILDQSGESLLPRRNNRSALPVTVFRSDETPPELISFILDLNAGILWLTFSETVDASTLNSSFLTLLNTSPRSSEPDTSLTLSLS